MQSITIGENRTRVTVGDRYQVTAGSSQYHSIVTVDRIEANRIFYTAVCPHGTNTPRQYDDTPSTFARCYIWDYFASKLDAEPTQEPADTPVIPNDTTKRSYKTWDDIRIPDESHYQIRGHAVKPAFGTFYTSKGYHWAVAEDRGYNMGLGNQSRILFYTQTRAQAETEAAKYAPTVGYFSRDVYA